MVPVLAPFTLRHVAKFRVLVPGKAALAVHWYCAFWLDSLLWMNWFHGGVRKYMILQTANKVVSHQWLVLEVSSRVLVMTSSQQLKWQTGHRQCLCSDAARLPFIMWSFLVTEEWQILAPSKCKVAMGTQYHRCLPQQVDSWCCWHTPSENC